MTLLQTTMEKLYFTNYEKPYKKIHTCIREHPQIPLNGKTQTLYRKLKDNYVRCTYQRTPLSKEGISMKRLFVECGICSKKAGSPTLCESCLHNRSAIEERDKIIETTVNKLNIINILLNEM